MQTLFGYNHRGIAVLKTNDFKQMILIGPFYYIKIYTSVSLIIIRQILLVYKAQITKNK